MTTVIPLLTVVVLISCNPTRDRRINRSWHTLTGHYNVYFNGEQKLLSVLEGLDKGTVNDFTKTLPVFCYGDAKAAKAVSGQLDEVIKKASLSIQNHTVGEYTDDSYLLMGKAHFLKQDYYAALESFQYVNSRYKDKGLRPIATAWIAKCYNGLQKHSEAEAVIGLLISEFGPKLSKGQAVKPTLKQRLFPPIPGEYYREMYATAADIAIKQEKHLSSIHYMQQALKYTTRKPDRIRYTYILGQQLLVADSLKFANQCFRNILSMNAPYDFEFNASINLARAYDIKDKSAAKKVRRSLKRMLRDDKNEGMYDQIHYELGNLEMKEKNRNEAIHQYKLAAAKSTRNANQKALAFLALGNIYLDIPDYKLAQAYYDSTLATLGKDYRDYQKITAKGEVLGQLIANLVVIESEDSLQALSKLSTAEIEQKIDKWIADEKLRIQQRAKEAQRQKALKKMAEQNQQFAPATNLNQGFGSGDAGQWYFYNASLIASGSADFFSLRKWGRRANEDFWRLSAKEKESDQADGNAPQKPDSASEEHSGALEDTVAATPGDGMSVGRKAWISDVPFTEEAFAKSRTRMLDAYYNIGVLYDEKLGDSKESSRAFETLIDRFPGNGYEPEVLYRLYKLNVVMKDSSRANYYKASLITRYPETPYALIVQGKSIKTAETDQNREVVLHYEKTYQAYLEGNYAEVKHMKMEADKRFPGNSLNPKFELLNALAIGKTDSTIVFKKELELIVKTYPRTDVADRAQGILNFIIKQEKGSKDTVKTKSPVEETFVHEPASPHYLIFATRDEKFDNNEGLNQFNRYNEEFGSLDNLKVNNYVTPEGYQLIMVREFADFKKALDYLNGMETLNVIKSQLKFSGSYMLFVISVSNFKKMLKEQKLDMYYRFYSEIKIKQPGKKN